MGELELVVGGRRHAGWKSVRVQRSLEQLASSFDLGFTDRWSRQHEPVAILAGADCTIEIDGERILTGYVDDVEVTSSATERGMTASGRAKTADLVDASAVHRPGQWSGMSLLGIASELCAPFGIGVRSEVELSDPVVRRFVLQHGEGAYEALERLARLKGVLVVSSPHGELVFTRSGRRSSRSRIERGVNILRGQIKTSTRDLHSEYIVKAQSQGSDDSYGDAAAGPKGTATDAEVGRYRPLIIMSDEQGSPAELKARAQWERNVRRGRSARLTYSVPGWTNAADEAWDVNTRVEVIDPWFGVAEELLIVSATFARGSEGTTTELELLRPAAFDVVAAEKRKKARGEGRLFS